MNVVGKVKVEVIVAPDGRVKSARAIGGHPLLVQPCLDAAKEWKFAAAVEESTQVVEFEFTGSN
jgi:outer membrane biosynthesis protein TonB